MSGDRETVDTAKQPGAEQGLQRAGRLKSPRRRNVLRWLKRGAMAAVAMAVAFAIIRAWIPRPISVDTGVATRGPLRVFVEEDGQTQVREAYVVSAPVSGTLRRIELDSGDRVTRGQVIARVLPPPSTLLDPRSRAQLQAELRAALARLRQADAALARAVAAREYAAAMAGRARRLSELAMGGAERDRYLTDERMAVEDHSAAREQRLAAAAEVQSIRARLGAGQADGSTEIPVRAPVDARVLRILRESAGPVLAGEALVTLGNTREIEVRVDVLSRDAIAIEPGARVWIEHWGGPKPLAGEVTRVEPTAFTHISALGIEEQRVNVFVALRRAPKELGDGFRVEARILTWQDDDVLKVPASAVFGHRGGWAVYTMTAGRAKLRPIQIGHRARLEVEVVGGLLPGARVILYPDERVSDGTSVKARPAPVR